MKKESIKKITATAMLSAVSMILVFLGFSIFPQVEFLKYDPADVPILIVSFAFGPLYGVCSSVILSVFQAIFWSADGIVGCVMNILSTCALIIPAGIIYKTHKTKKNAVIGLVAGSVCTILVMLLFNYIITPIYRGFPRPAIVPLLPWICAFNVIKSAVNSTLTFFLYKQIGKIIKKF